MMNFLLKIICKYCLHKF